MAERSVKSEHGGDFFLPPGFRFHPTDEEVITSYLLRKFLNPSFDPRAMGEVDLNKCEPWDLPSKAKIGEKEWFFFCHKDMKYPTGVRTNRATKEGYWKATGRDREIFKQDSAGGRELVGMKKTLVFYMGRAPRGSKTNWVMHEFRLEGSSRHNNSFNPKDEWVVCKVHHKNNGESKKAAEEYSAGTPNVSSVEAGDGDEFLADSLMDYSSGLHFNSAGSLPNTSMNAAAPYNADYSSISSTAPGATTTTTLSSFVIGQLPNNNNYGLKDAAIMNNLHQQFAATNPTVPRSSMINGYSSSQWNMLLGADPTAMGTSYNLHHQAMVAKALGGVIVPPHFAGGLASSSVAGILQQNSLKLGNYGGSYAANLTSSAAVNTATTNGAAAENLGARQVRY